MLPILLAAAQGAIDGGDSGGGNEHARFIGNPPAALRFLGVRYAIGGSSGLPRRRLFS